MKAAAILGLNRAGVIERERPSIAGDYVLLKVLVAPMCNEHVAFSDGAYLERNRPDSLGHEMAGVVLEAPPSSKLAVGDRVVALCGYPCGRCIPCRRGLYAHCTDNQDPREMSQSPSGESGFAELAVKPDWMCVPIPNSISLDRAALLCCGLGPTFGAMQRVRPSPGSTVLICGGGPVGLGGVINARVRGLRTVILTGSPYRGSLAKSLGAELVIDPNSQNALQQLGDFTGDGGIDLSLECSGQPRQQMLAVESLAHLGTAAFLAEPGRLEIDVDRHLVQKGVTILGTLDINRSDADLLMQVIGDLGSVSDTYITHRYRLDDIQSAFEQQASRECGKILLYPWPDEYAGDLNGA